MKKLLFLLFILPLTLFISCASDDSSDLTSTDCVEINSLTLDGIEYIIPSSLQGGEILEEKCGHVDDFHVIELEPADNYTFIQHLNGTKISELRLATPTSLLDGTIVSNDTTTVGLIQINKDGNTVNYLLESGYDIYTTIDSQGQSMKCIKNGLFVNQYDSSDNLIASFTLNCKL